MEQFGLAFVVVPNLQNPLHEPLGDDHHLLIKAVPAVTDEICQLFDADADVPEAGVVGRNGGNKPKNEAFFLQGQLIASFNEPVVSDDQGVFGRFWHKENNYFCHSIQNPSPVK